MKYVVRTPAGTWHYRRRLPKDVSETLRRGEFKRIIGFSEKDAVQNFPKVNAEFERLVSETRCRRATPPSTPSTPSTPLGVHRAATIRAKELATQAVALSAHTVLAGDDPEAADLLRESYLASLPYDPKTGEPVGGDAVEVRALAILASGGALHRPDPTLEDARKLYLKERVGDDGKKRLELDRVFRLIREALQRDRTLSSLKREDAREVRDHMRDGRAASSVDRYLNVVRAVINHAIRELDLNGVVNPFMNLEAAPGENGDPDRDKRRPYTEKEAEAVAVRIRARGRKDLRLIWQILEGTGCRLAEVAGLRTSDVHLDHDVPHITVAWHDERRIKNKVSRRDVPLLGTALEAAREAVTAAGDSPMLFPAYGRIGGPSSASAALSKHVRTVVTDPKVGPAHSLRHLMKDRLRLAGVEKSEQDIILGHSSGDVGEDYGGDEGRLRAGERALKAALGIPNKLPEG